MAKRKHRFIAHPAREEEIKFFCRRSNKCINCQYVLIYCDSLPVALMIWHRGQRTRYYFRSDFLTSRFHAIRCGIAWKQYMRKRWHIEPTRSP